MEKIYQVFISSTYKDLIEERNAVLQVLLEINCIPVGMELFPAGDDDQITTIKKMIDSCDYYILIIGGRYGSLAKGGVSYTQLEYQYAISKGIPTISFLHRKPENLPVSKVDEDKESKEKLENFKKIVQQKMCAYWEDKAELKAIAVVSVSRLIKDKPRMGWVRNLSDYSLEESIAVRKYISNFVPRRNELNKFFEDTIINAESGDRIDILGISQRMTFKHIPGVDVFAAKIVQGCRFRILLQHPYSSSISTIENLSKDYGFKDLRESILSVINGPIRELQKKLEEKTTRHNRINGSIEIRLHKDLFSPISYHAFTDRAFNIKVLIGLYYAHIEGSYCPTFEIEDKNTKKEASRHFETLWNRSEGNVLIKANSQKIISNIDDYRSETYDFTYFEQGLSKGISNYEPYKWIANKFMNKAKQIAEVANISHKDKVLDYGCAKGYLVKAFRKLKYDAYGCDISHYAITNCDPEVKEYCHLIEENELMADGLTANVFHTVSFIHVLEHLEVEEIHKILTFIKPVTLKGVYIEVPLGADGKYNNSRHEIDNTHIQKQPIEWWADQLTSCGYAVAHQKAIHDDWAELYCTVN